MTNKTFDPRQAADHGFQLKRRSHLSAINAELYELEHEPTGARHLHIARDDRENTFSVAFKTVPTDATGVAHILEHTVLCGSKNYPVRDPFFSMLKRSLSSFMNAFTAADWTMYPFATSNRKDFYNLMDVYLDAAFFPKIDAISFKQEGHRLELEPAVDGAPAHLVYKGVVYNEMKGAMSSPDQVMARSLLNALYPDTTYRFNSGGDPAVIPALSHRDLVEFHQRHYHPSNAYFFTYGSLPLNAHLAAVNETVLRHYERIDPQTTVPSQPRWSAPREAIYTYPISPEEDPARKSQFCLAWLTADIKNAFDVLVLKLLAEILLGNAASPLRKALIDSELGSALADVTGFDADNRDAFFACGLKDVRAADAHEIEQIIMTVLEKLVRDGIDKSLIESAIHQLEFRRREVTNTPYPYGIKLLISFCSAWFHGGDVERVLRFDEDLERIRREAAAGPFFEDWIQRSFLENPHQVRFTLKPDPRLAQAEDERIRMVLADKLAALGPENISALKKDAADLKALQEREEDVSVLPTLALTDVDPGIQTVTPSAAYPAMPAVCYAQPTAGITYFSAAIGVAGLGAEQLPLVPFFCYALPRIDTATRDYQAVVRFIDRYTGGVGLSAQARTRLDEEGRATPLVTIDGKALQRHQSRLLDIIAELLFSADFGNAQRLKRLLLEYKAGLESMVVHNGHRLAISLSARAFSKAAFLSEMWGGVHQLKAIKQTAAALDEEGLEKLGQTLNGVRRALVRKDNLLPALIGEDAALTALSPRFSAPNVFSDVARSVSGDVFSDAPEIAAEKGPVQEGWSTSTAVSFVARTFDTVRMDHADAPALAVISKMLRSLYLHREIREKGGAYGGFALYQLESGLFSFASYRDPHITGTLNAFAGACEFIRSGRYKDEDVKEAILQVCADIDKPQPPGPAARKAFYRRIIGMSDVLRARFKERLLSLEKGDVKRVAADYFGPRSGREGTAVISNETLLKQANEKRPAALTIHHI